MSKFEWQIKYITQNNQLMKFLNDNYDELSRTDWSYVLKSNAFDWNVVEKYPEYVPWTRICMFKQMPIDVIESNIDRIDWYAISAFQQLTVEFVDKYKHSLALDRLCKNDRCLKIHDHVEELKNKYDDPPHHKLWDMLLNGFKPTAPAVYTRKYDDYDDSTILPSDPKYKEESFKKKAKKTKKVEKMEDTTKSKTKKIKTSKTKVEVKIDYSNMTKAELKEILASRNVKYLYHDTLEILRNKCKESENNVK